jgi:uncharacterized protein YndB with AHSA1/START domain
MHGHTLQVTAEPNRPSLLTRYVVSAPRTLVYEAFTRPELLQQWVGVGDRQTTAVRLDVRVGGTWELVHHDPEGRESNFHGVFTFVNRPERLIRTIVSDQSPADEALETVSFEEKNGETEIVTSAAYRSVEARDAHAETTRRELTQGYEKLEGLLDLMKNSGD